MHFFCEKQHSGLGLIDGTRRTVQGKSAGLAFFDAFFHVQQRLNTLAFAGAPHNGVSEFFKNDGLDGPRPAEVGHQRHIPFAVAGKQQKLAAVPETV